MLEATALVIALVQGFEDKAAGGRCRAGPSAVIRFLQRNMR